MKTTLFLLIALFPSIILAQLPQSVNLTQPQYRELREFQAYLAPNVKQEIITLLTTGPNGRKTMLDTNVSNTYRWTSDVANFYLSRPQHFRRRLMRDFSNMISEENIDTFATKPWDERYDEVASFMFRNSNHATRWLTDLGYHPRPMNQIFYEFKQRTEARDARLKAKGITEPWLEPFDAAASAAHQPMQQAGFKRDIKSGDDHYALQTTKAIAFITQQGGIIAEDWKLYRDHWEAKVNQIRDLTQRTAEFRKGPDPLHFLFTKMAPKIPQGDPPALVFLSPSLKFAYSEIISAKYSNFIAHARKPAPQSSSVLKTQKGMTWTKAIQDRVVMCYTQRRDARIDRMLTIRQDEDFSLAGDLLPQYPPEKLKELEAIDEAFRKGLVHVALKDGIVNVGQPTPKTPSSAPVSKPSTPVPPHANPAPTTPAAPILTFEQLVTFEFDYRTPYCAHTPQLEQLFLDSGVDPKVIEQSKRGRVYENITKEEKNQKIPWPNTGANHPDATLPKLANQQLGKALGFLLSKDKPLDNARVIQFFALVNGKEKPSMSGIMFEAYKQYSQNFRLDENQSHKENARRLAKESLEWCQERVNALFVSQRGSRDGGKRAALARLDLQTEFDAHTYALEAWNSLHPPLTTALLRSEYESDALYCTIALPIGAFEKMNEKYKALSGGRSWLADIHRAMSGKELAQLGSLEGQKNTGLSSISEMYKVDLLDTARLCWEHARDEQTLLGILENPHLSSGDIFYIDKYFMMVVSEKGYLNKYKSLPHFLATNIQKDALERAYTVFNLAVAGTAFEVEKNRTQVRLQLAGHQLPFTGHVPEAFGIGN